MPIDQKKWHWEQGIKFALEGIKILFLLNGAAAVSILTFIGGTSEKSPWVVSSLIMFAAGSFMAAATMFFAYLSQLNYGNADQVDVNDAISTNIFNDYWNRGSKRHGNTYISIWSSMGFFALGVISAAIGMY